MTPRSGRCELLLSRAVTRRSLLGGAFAAVAAVPLISLVRADAATTLPLTVTNNTGTFGDGDIHLYVVGTDLDSGRQGVVTPGGFHAVELSDNGADFSLALSASPIALPHLSGRIYFSLGDKLAFPVVADGAGNPALQHPAGWVDSDASFGVLYDVVEFTFNDAGMFCNTTSVDMFGVPAEITLAGAKTQTVGTFKPGARAAIFAAIAAEPAFAPLIVDDLRVIAPGHGLEAGKFATDFYDSYVDQVYAKYAGTDLRIATNAGTFTGRVQGDSFVFDNGAAAMARPSTRDILFCDGKLAAPNDGITGPVAAVLGAAYNRSTLLTTADQPTTDPATFYQETVTNHYSRVLHENVADGRIYGFAFDDVADFASFIQDTAPTKFTLNLTPFA
jgi:Beta-1,3-glucanase